MVRWRAEHRCALSTMKTRRYRETSLVPCGSRRPEVCAICLEEFSVKQVWTAYFYRELLLLVCFPVLPVSTSVVQSQLQAWTLRETQTRWQDLKSCRQAKETIETINGPKKYCVYQGRRLG